MEKKKQFEDINFYNMAKGCINFLIKKYYKKLSTETKNNLFDYCYLHILNNISDKKDFNLYSEDKSKNYYILDNLTKNAIDKFFREKKEHLFFSELVNKNDKEFDLDRVGIISDFDIYNLEYNELKQILKAFLKTQDKTTAKLVILNLKGVSTVNIEKALKIYRTEQFKKLQFFREKFSDHLVNIGYLGSPVDFCLTKRAKTSDANKRLKQKKKNVVDYSLYPSDFKIYKLLRNENDLTKYAVEIGKSTDYIKNLIYHNAKNGSKLFLFEIQILRKKFYNSLKLEELVEVG